MMRKDFWQSNQSLF